MIYSSRGMIIAGCSWAMVIVQLMKILIPQTQTWKQLVESFLHWDNAIHGIHFACQPCQGGSVNIHGPMPAVWKSGKADLLLWGQLGRIGTHLGLARLSDCGRQDRFCRDCCCSCRNNVVLHHVSAVALVFAGGVVLAEDVGCHWWSCQQHAVCRHARIVSEIQLLRGSSKRPAA